MTMGRVLDSSYWPTLVPCGTGDKRADWKWIVKTAVISSIAILITDVASWPSSYRALKSNHGIILLFIVNVNAIVSGMLSNAAAIISILSGNFSLTGGVVDSPNAYFDDSSRRSRGGEHVALGSVSLSNPSEDASPDSSANLSEHTVVNTSINTITIILTAPSIRSLTPPPDYNSATINAKTSLLLRK
ncbi:hypothetical protein HYPSUDRAFT_60030 [Hypholoma sublateritium FD-334 SS-4]|uniref:Uncharacterized protein n=1 Tax=Hypholoma sublateritium (strain FD-334 SS-4) TaxID=945553 RepID=A0A0D2LQZ3_HYPSF|nr:hypothetical protein HYPSUDRAFT_60030 [Hypholoma sublateritium FD-334 SS-4]